MARDWTQMDPANFGATDGTQLALDVSEPDACGTPDLFATLNGE